MGPVSPVSSQQSLPQWEAEREFGYFSGARLAGVDEAGRGPLAGGVIAAAFWLAPDQLKGWDWSVVRDSKRLSPNRRAALELELRKRGCFGLGMASVAEIDEINILQASRLAMRRAIAGLVDRPDFKGLKLDRVLVDGPKKAGSKWPETALVKGDSRSFLIAGASILAKCERDRLMYDLDIAFPDYGFAQHKGYPTKSHFEALRRFGPSPVHRRSFRLA